MGESQIVGITRAAAILGGFAVLIAASPGRGDDAKKVAEKATSGRIRVWAFELKDEGPREERMQGIRILSVDPETGESTKVGTAEKIGDRPSPTADTRPGTGTVRARRMKVSGFRI